MNQRSSSHVLTGTRIRERRLALSRLQSEVARAAGISAAYLNLIEHNRRPVGDALMVRLADILHVPTEELVAGREEARIAAMREAAARLPLPLSEGDAELDQAPEFLARFPGWAGVVIASARHAERLEQKLVSLSDRMTQDPYLLTTLHEVMSAITSLRSTASILAEEGGAIPSDWRQRFHANLDEDSQRLSQTAQSLVAYLDSFEADGAIFTPQEEVEAWMAADRPPIDDPEGPLVSDAARAMARQNLALMRADEDALPDAALLRALPRAKGDPLRLADALKRPLDLVMRRLAALRPRGFEGAGLLVCDGSGALILRSPAAGFPLPRPGDTCPLWPLFHALAMPHTALHRRLEAPDGRRFDTISHATRRQPDGIAGPVLTQAQMLILPAGPDGPLSPGPIIPIGPACRICPRDHCPARREPSILATS